MHCWRHLEGSERPRPASLRFTATLRDILDRGVAEGVFRPGIDPVQLDITIAVVGRYYLTNRLTGGSTSSATS